jgi:murein DD-endopeptidase MepM/ murein hydrolase activator NlpD
MFPLSDFCKRNGNIESCMTRAALAGGLLLVAGSVASLWAGYELGRGAAGDAAVAAETAELLDMLQTERRVIADAKAEQRAHLDALALKLAELQAHLMRLDALGDRLVDVGKLDEGEFDFSAPPPLGGVDESLPGDGQSAKELSVEMERVAGLLADREQKLTMLERLLMNREVMAEITPSGRPVKKGWLSSGFGRRTDPFNGKKSYHRGVDFAGKPGSEVVAVAAGVVERARHQPGYGNVIEIRHADGYSTLYAHNKENLVKPGDVVDKGQTIALLGSTGRSSGPHVHFEVHHDGKIVDPLRFVRAH